MGAASEKIDLGRGCHVKGVFPSFIIIVIKKFFYDIVPTMHIISK